MNINKVTHIDKENQKTDTSKNCDYMYNSNDIRSKKSTTKVTYKNGLKYATSVVAKHGKSKLF